eukprot:2309517-Prymnesium_polylepis.1
MGDVEMQPLKPDLRAELESMPVSALQNRARKDGIDAWKIEEAIDTVHIKNSLIELILDHEPQGPPTSDGEGIASFSHPHPSYGIVKEADEKPIGVAVEDSGHLCIEGLRVIVSVPEIYHPEGGGCIVAIPPHRASSSATSGIPFPNKGFHDKRPDVLAGYLTSS